MSLAHVLVIGNELFAARELAVLLSIGGGPWHGTGVPFTWWNACACYITSTGVVLYRVVIGVVVVGVCGVTVVIVVSGHWRGVWWRVRGHAARQLGCLVNRVRSGVCG